MASSNRHWPSMFKSKPCNHHQWQHDSLISASCHRPSFTTGGCEERSPEPKPRWNPKPEQIRILEAIFNSGMVNPPRDEIRKIRAQLQEYGQVGDANVFYWFQNRKSRSKHKLRHLQNTSKQQQNSSPQQQTATQLPPTTITLTTTAPSSSSSSSEKSSPKGSSKRKSALSLSCSGAIDHMSNSPTGSVNQTYSQAQNEFVPEPFYFPLQQGSSGGGFTEGFCFSELSNVVQGQNHTVGPCTSLLLTEMLNSSASASKKEVYPGEKIMKMQSPASYSINNPPITHTIGLAPPYPTDTHNVPFTVPSNINQIQVVGDHESRCEESARSTVMINDVALEVAVGPFNVREAFGDDFALIHSSGQPVLTNEWGVTLHPLQHGASYYLLPLSMTETYLKWGS